MTVSFSEEEERGDRSTEVERRGEDRDVQVETRNMKYFQVFRNILTEMFMLIIQRVR